MTYIAKAFELKNLKGISQKTLAEHLNLYSGYVKHYNLASDLMDTYANQEDTQFLMTELNRRRSFEYNGIKNLSQLLAA